MNQEIRKGTISLQGGGKRKEILDVTAQTGAATIKSGKREIHLEPGSRLTIETIEQLPEIRQAVLIESSGSYSGKAVRHFINVFGFHFLKTGELNFVGNRWSEIEEMHRQGWQTPTISIDRQ